MNHTTYLFVLFLWLFQGKCQILADADSYTVQEKNQLLNGYKFAGLFKVIEAKRISEERREDLVLTVKYKVTIALTDVIPDLIKKQEFEIIVTILLDGGLKLASPDDWFPLEKGKVFLAGFKSEKLQEGQDVYPLIALNEVEAGFRDCKVFYKTVMAERKEIPKRLAKVVNDNMARLTGLYFELIENYDFITYHDDDGSKSFIANQQKSIFVHPDFVPTLIEYLRSDKVALPRKANLISSIVLPETAPPEIQRNLARCVLEVIFKAHGTKNEDIPGNLLDFFSRNFLEGAKSTLDFKKTLPDAEKRDLFLKLARDEKIVSEEKVRTILLAWAEGSKKKEEPKKK